MIRVAKGMVLLRSAHWSRPRVPAKRVGQSDPADLAASSRPGPALPIAPGPHSAHPAARAASPGLGRCGTVAPSRLVTTEAWVTGGHASSTARWHRCQPPSWPGRDGKSWCSWRRPPGSASTCFAGLSAARARHNLSVARQYQHDTHITTRSSCIVGVVHKQYRKYCAE
jgi:hypothetical protein